MLPEAELFVLADRMTVEVLGRIRDEELRIELPPIVGVTGGATTAAATLRVVVAEHLADERALPAVLDGTSASGDGRGAASVSVPDTRDRRRDALVQAGDAAVAAAERAPAHGRGNDVADFLLRSTVIRSLTAHYVAAYLGSTACPLPEELARPLWERTAPYAGYWRASGLFREPTPVPHLASWRDTFLRTAGHEPHPLGH